MHQFLSWARNTNYSTLLHFTTLLMGVKTGMHHQLRWGNFTSKSTEFHDDACKLRSSVPDVMRLHLVFMSDAKATGRRKTAFPD